jgi:hypothetical protein
MGRGIIIYLAGFCDGEGTITIVKQVRIQRATPSYIGMLSVGNTNEEVLDLYVKTFGGKITQTKQWSQRHKPYFQWWIYSSGMVKALEAMLPYLIIKREAAQLVIALQKTIWGQMRRGGRGGRGKKVSPGELEIREKLYQQFKSLTSKR